MARDSFNKFAALFKDVARRTERVTSLGDRTAQRVAQAPIEIIGVEDFAVSNMPSQGEPTEAYLTFNGDQPSGLAETNEQRIVILDTTDLELTTKWTIECWFQKTQSDQGSSNPSLINKRNATGYDFKLFGTEVRIGTGGNGTAVSLTVNDTNWHHVVGIYNNVGGNGDLELRIDNSSSDTATGIAEASFAAEDLWIGQRQGGNQHTVKANIDEVRIWNAVLTEAQIEDYRFKNLNPREPRIVYLINTGSTNKIDFGSPTKLDDMFSSLDTLEFWIYPVSDGPGDLGIIFDQDTLWNLRTGNESGNAVPLRLTSEFSTNTGIWETDVLLPLDQWSHCSVSYDNGNVNNNPQILIMGTPSPITEVVAPVGSAVSDGTKSLTAGHASSSADVWIEDIRFYNNKQRTQNEVLSDFRIALKGNESGLTAYWPMYEASGSTIKDLTLTPADGTITGFEWGGLRGQWSLNDGSGTTTKDWTGAGNDGTFAGDSNPAWVTNKVSSITDHTPCILVGECVI